jgi:ribosome maturation factor RimP
MELYPMRVSIHLVFDLEKQQFEVFDIEIPEKAKHVEQTVKKEADLMVERCNELTKKMTNINYEYLMYS